MKIHFIICDGILYPALDGILYQHREHRCHMIDMLEFNRSILAAGVRFRPRVCTILLIMCLYRPSHHVDPARVALPRLNVDLGQLWVGSRTS